MLASFIDAISPRGPRVPIRHSDGQIPLWSILLYIFLWSTWVASLWSPYYGVTFDAIKASYGDSDLYTISRSKDRVTTWSCYCNTELCDWTILQHFNLGVFPSCHSPNDMTSLPMDVCVPMTRKPLSSIAQWTSILELTRDLVVYILHVY